MEDEVMEQIRARLAAATSVAAALAKSLEALDENTLQTLELWLSKQEGNLRCGQCCAQMPRGKATSVCIACGSKRPPLPNTLEFDFKVSFAFLQFLETIHPPLKSGSRRSWNSIESPASQSPEPTAITADLSVEREAIETVEFIEHLKEEFSINKNTSINGFQGSPLDGSSGSIAAEESREADDVRETDDGKYADDFGDFQESWGDTAVETSHERIEDVPKPHGFPHLDQSSTNLETARVVREPEVAFGAAANSEVNSWETEWDYPTSHSLATKTQLEENVQSDITVKNSKEVTFAEPQVSEYDLSFFESFGGIGMKDENVSTETDVDATFWDFQNTNFANSKLASVKAMERFASDTSAFTTITEADSDSGDSSLEVLPPPRSPLDFLGEIGANSGQDDLVGSLKTHELDDFQKVAAASHPLATTSPALQDPFSWPLDTLGNLPSQLIEDDVENFEGTSAATLETSRQVALDPFPWPLEEFDKETTNGAQAQEQLDLMDPGRSQSEANKVDPFSWPLDTFNQTTSVANEGNVIGLESACQPQVHDTNEDDSEDWGDAEFVGSEVQPTNESQFKSNMDLLPFPSGSLPLRTSFSSNFIARDVYMDRDRFLLDQSSSKQGVPNFSAASPDNFTDVGPGLDILINMEGQKPIAGADIKCTHVRSLSFGDFDRKPSVSDNIDDLFKRSVSHGNLHGKDMAERDELLKALQAPSIPQPAPLSSESGEDILNFLNLRPASSQVNAPQGSGNSTKPLHVRSVSFDTVELVPDEQSDEMFQFFHTRSHSAGSSATKSSAVEDGHSSSIENDIFNKIPSMPKAPPVESSVINDDPFSFIHAAIAPPTQPEAVEVKVGTNNDDDDDFFEWKSAETPAITPAETSVQTVFQPSVSASALSQQDLFQWTSPSKPSSSPSKPSGTGSLSGLLSLAGGLPPSQIRTASKEDDLFAALSRNSSNTGGSQTRQAAMQADARPQSSIEAHSSNPGDDSEDEFSDFVSTGVLSSAPLPTSTQPPVGHADQPAFDVSFFETAQPNSSEKRNLDFFGDLMGLNFTNA
ncbi:hypothetical protein KC19_4G001100 [Ceratodon purpureus]|uniref:Uncharacterized protein n=1 Tax=Ceratodon purpureus TaxID=3225 RepID=A0A8T0I3S6_CERPU|nr:hypothetical protein KC19_4G001100 [Ceratodon purpureus]